jgi:hypothetical protein
MPLRGVKANKKILKLNCKHQLLVDADDVNILGGGGGGSKHALRKSTELL